jgi:hypothetical protein
MGDEAAQADHDAEMRDGDDGRRRRPAPPLDD